MRLSISAAKLHHTGKKEINLARTPCPAHLRMSDECKAELNDPVGPFVSLMNGSKSLRLMSACALGCA